jgi:hypothetical protein
VNSTSKCNRTLFVASPQTGAMFIACGSFLHEGKIDYTVISQLGICLCFLKQPETFLSWQHSPTALSARNLSESLQRTCGAGGSIKPRVERQRNPGLPRLMIPSPRSGRQSVPHKLCRPFHGLSRFCLIKPRVPLRSTLGFMLPAAPQTR